MVVSYFKVCKYTLLLLNVLFPPKVSHFIFELMVILPVLSISNYLLIVDTNVTWCLPSLSLPPTSHSIGMNYLTVHVTCFVPIWLYHFEMVIHVCAFHF